MTYFDRDSELFEGALSYAMIELEKSSPIRFNDYYQYYDANDESTKYIFELSMDDKKAVHCSYTLSKEASIIETESEGTLRSRAMLHQDFMELVDTFIVTGNFTTNN